MDNIEEFLYLINSVFAPMIAVMIADFFFNKKRRAVKEWDWANLAVWLIGLILYRALMHVDIIIGYTLPDIVIMDSDGECKVWKHFGYEDFKGRL